jgi:azurin
MKLNMKTTLPSLLAIAALTLMAACNKAPETAADKSASPAATAAATPEAPDPNLPEKKVEITGNDLMKYDVTAIEAKPGQKVTVTLKNVGSAPKVSMGHNFVLLVPDQDPAKFVEASVPYLGKDAIAPELLNKVIAHTKLLGPGESDTVSFAAPRKPGTYNYICSFPGHFAIGMKGTLTVQ